MTYAKVSNGSVIGYPYSFLDMRRDHPDTIFNADDNLAQAIEHGRYPVVENPPEVDSRHQYITPKSIGDWEIVDDEVITTYTVHDRTLQERRDELIPRLKDRRWSEEISGVDITIGEDIVPVSTARGDDRTALHMEFSRIVANIRPDGATFNFADTVPRSVSNEDMMLAIQAALNHVQTCFDRESVVTNLIKDATTHAAMDAAEAAIEDGWPN